MIPMNEYPASSVVPIFFTTYGKTNGESITLTGLAVTDIEIYKGTSMTQRASDAGYTLLDTDGIDIDSVTGLHGFSIDLGDNTDAGFYAVGSFYTVVVSTVTIDSQTVTFIADRFRIVAAEAISGKPKVDVDGWLGTACATPGTAGVPSVDTVRISTSATAADNAETAFLGTINSWDDFVDAAGKVTINATSVTSIWTDTTVSDFTAALSIGKSIMNGVSLGTGLTVARCTLTDTLTTYTGNTVQTGDSFARIGATGSGLTTLATAAALATVQADTDDIQARLPAALTADGNIKADTLRVNGTAQTAGDLAALINALALYTTRVVARATAGAAATTTSIPTSAFSPSGSVADQFKGRIVIFDAATATAALRGQATDITASTGAATPTLTVTALTTAPASGDTFSVV